MPFKDPNMGERRLLIVGPLPSEKYKNYGGTTVLMQNFKDFLDSNGYYYVFLKTSFFGKFNFGKFGNALDLIYLFVAFLYKLRNVDIVMFNFSNRGFVHVLPFLVRVAYFFKKKIVIRKFAGSVEVFWNKLSERKKRQLTKMFSHSDLIFQETRNGITYLQELTKEPLNIEWFPNVRKPYLNAIKVRSIKPKRFAFISLITKTKGVDELLEAASQLPKDYIVDFYGRIDNQEYDKSAFEGYEHVSYKGALDSKDVLPTLQKYDMLVLPSYSEGYPGIIIEAFSAGISVIATDVGGIPEIVTHRQNGILVCPRSAKALENAMLSISEDEYGRLSKNAFDSFNLHFNSDKINDSIYRKIISL